MWDLFGFKKRAQEKAERERNRTRFLQVREAFVRCIAKRIAAAEEMNRQRSSLPTNLTDAQLSDLLERTEFGMGDDVDCESENLARDLTRGIILNEERTIEEIVRKLESTRYPWRFAKLIHDEARAT